MVDVGDTSPGSGIQGALGWSSRIGEALTRDLFVLHAQRIVDVVSGLTLRHELLLRMVDRKRLIPAGEFVLAAEEFGSIREIDRWVVGRAIEIAARGHAVDVNLSVRSADDEMLDLIRGGFEETDAREVIWYWS
jgi:EAL domain-containing protein (putative c-di-GMP-specific phosphodiesterase class I)